MLQVTAAVRWVGEHCVIYVQQDRSVPEAHLHDLAAAFDESIYPTLTNVLGSEPNPGIDGDSKIHILVYPFGTTKIRGYFNRPDIDPAFGGLSNRQELISLDLARVLYDLEEAEATAAHEFAHLIGHYREYMLDDSPERALEAEWVDEGIAMYAEMVCGYGYLVGPELASFAANPGKTLTCWGSTLSDYGASLAFMQYLMERFGSGFASVLVNERLDGSAGIDAALASWGRPERFADLFGDWLAANFLDGRIDSQPPFGYAALDLQAAATSLSGTFPRIGSGLAPNHGALYLDLPVSDPAAPLRVVIDGEDGTPLRAALISWNPDSEPVTFAITSVPIQGDYAGGSAISGLGFSRHALAVWGMGQDSESIDFSFKYSLAFAPTTDHEFLDVGAGNAFYLYIQSLLESGVISGQERPAGSGLWFFDPEEPLLRASFCKMIVGALGLHTPEVDVESSPSFRDVALEWQGGQPVVYPYDYIEEAYASGLVLGMGDGTFQPWESITRVQLVRMIIRGAAAAGEPLAAYSGPQRFVDVSPSEPYYQEVMAAYQAGIINGWQGSDGRWYFGPWDTANRSHVAKMLSNLLDRLISTVDS